MRLIKMLTASFGVLLFIAFFSGQALAQVELYLYPDNPVLTDDWADFQAPFVRSENRTYSMWYASGIYPNPPTEIDYATSMDGKNWLEYAGNPILIQGDSGSWDQSGISSPSILRFGNVYYMAYAGTNGYFWRIGVATSLDKVTWYKYPGNPLFNPGEFGEWDSQGVRDPMAIFDGTEFKLYYTGDDGSTTRIGLATSTDGLTWSRASNNPVLSEGQAGDWDSENVAHPFVYFDGRRYYMYYSGCAGSGYYGPSYNIGLATSTDGYRWRKAQDLNPVLRYAQQPWFDSSAILQPSALLEGGTIKFWFTGNRSGSTSIGFAHSKPLFVDVTPATTEILPGNPLDLSITVTNASGGAVAFQLWSDVTLPNGNSYAGNPVLGPEALNVGPNGTFNDNFSLFVPIQALPNSGYRLRTEVGNHPNEIQDFSEFEFEILPLP